MKLRTLLTVALAALLVTTAAMAQAQMGKKGRAKGEGCLPRLAQQLDLTDAQKQSITDIMQDLRDKCRPIMQSNLSKEDKIAQITPLRDQARDDVMNVLTAEQLQKAEELGLLDNMFGKRNGNPVDKAREGFKWALGQLNLTDDQKAQLKDIFADSSTEMQAVKNNTSLTAEQKKAAALEIRQRTRDSVMATLTSEQQSQLQQWLADHPPIQGTRSPRKAN